MKPPTSEELHALERLLGDPSEAVAAGVVRRLQALGEAAHEMLERASEDGEPLARVRARRLLEEHRAAIVPRAFARHLEDGFDLEGAAVLLARLENPQLEADAVAARLDELAGLVNEEMTERGPEPQLLGRALALSEVLGRREGFRGNKEEYYDVRNSMIDAVLIRHLGIPISLSLIYILVGRRAGLTVHGVGMPYHFLASVEEEGHDAIILDPFDGGRMLSRRDCQKLLERYRHGFKEDYLRPVSDRDILRRMMANLVRIHLERGERARMQSLYQMVNMLQSSESTDP